MISVCIKTPREMIVFYMDTLFVFAQNQLCSGNSHMVFICNLKDICTIPLGCNYLYKLISDDPCQMATNSYIF